jgi:riboflavin synthase
MFTGIITHTTAVLGSKSGADGLTMTFKRPKGWDDLVLGESIATNGVCLTVSAIHEDSYECLLMPETLHKTSFGADLPESVNLERSLSVSDRFGGHFVQGHVDGTGTVEKIDTADGWRVSVAFPEVNKELVIPKGSITINGVSLTVAELSDNVLGVAIIPHTLEHTTLNMLRVGDKVNLEFDTIGKYVVNIMKAQKVKEDEHAKSTKG